MSQLPETSAPQRRGTNPAPAAYAWKDAEYFLHGEIPVKEFMKMLRRAECLALLAEARKYARIESVTTAAVLAGFFSYPNPLVLFAAVIVNCFIACRVLFAMTDAADEFLPAQMEDYVLQNPGVSGSPKMLPVEVNYLAAGKQKPPGAKTLREFIR